MECKVHKRFPSAFHAKNQHLWEGGFHSTTPPYVTSIIIISEDLPIIIVFYHLTHSLLDILHRLYHIKM